MCRYSVAFIMLLLVSGCAGRPKFGSVDDYADIARRNDPAVTTANAADIVEGYSVEFELPNPIFGPSSYSAGRVDPSHQSKILCRATLLNDFSTQADMLVRCPDSLGVSEAEECREVYHADQVREGKFRIRISMESGFSERSMERDNWNIYLENARGVMIEPNEYTESPVMTMSDIFHSNLTQEDLPRYLLYRDITLYFNRQAFWGEDLLGPENPYLVMVMSVDQRIVARVAWNLRNRESR